MQKFAIFGGTFNPVHWGHLLMAEMAIDQMALDRVIWVPTFQPHYKTPDIIAFQHRLTMLELAIEAHPQFHISTIEREQTQPTYAVDTFLALQTRYPTCEWYWIIGLDAFQSLPRWYRRQDLIPQCNWLIAPRQQSGDIAIAVPLSKASASEAPHSAPSTPPWPGHLDGQSIGVQVAQQLAAESIDIRWQMLAMPLIEISSSLIRQRCRQQRSIRYLVPDKVRQYILEHELYRSHESQP